MKELSIKEKAQRYDEALDRAKNIKTGKCETTFIFTEGLFNYLFPELEECNEEEVREAMIDFFKHEREEGVVVSHYGVNIERMIAWLENKGQTFTKKGVDDAYLAGVRDAKQELEKQDGQKPQGKSALEAIKEEKVDNANKVEPKDYNGIDPYFGKPVDKVESKFKVGDWVVSPNGGYWHIDRIENNRYEVTSDTGKCACANWPLDTDLYHLWTIQDAKDGDVLVASDDSIFLFGGVVDCACKYYVALTACNDVKINKEVDGGYWETSRVVHPATKEQRERFFAAMHDAGYEWDAEKKELKEISQRMISAEAKEAMYGKPTAWSEEDEKMVNNILTPLAGRFPWNIYQPMYDWLKSLKQRIGE